MQVPRPSEDTKRRFDELVESLGPDVKQAQMMGRPTLMTGRTMVASLNGDVLGIRLGRDSSVFNEALKVEGAAVFQPGPRHEFKDWVQIPASSADEWLPFTVAALEAARR